MADYKKTGRAQRLVVAGCLVERYRADIQKSIPEVDAVLGTNELGKITALCEGVTPASAPVEPYLYHDLTARVFTTPRYSAYIKIAEGCDHPCTFCIIPQLRGKFRSRRFESVIAEAERLAHQGVREVTLIGQDTTCYGEDFDLKDGLALLLEKLAKIDDLRKVKGFGAKKLEKLKSFLTVSGPTTVAVKKVQADQKSEPATAPPTAQGRRPQNR